MEEMVVWREYGIQGHSGTHPHGRAWEGAFEAQCEHLLAPLLGTTPQQIAIMGTLTANLSMFFLQLYKPTREKYKIVMEKSTFPSDKFMVEGHIERLGLDVSGTVVMVEADDNGIVKDEDIIACIGQQDVSLLLLGAVNYLTDQFFDCLKICKAAKENRVVTILDLAHAVGNVECELDEWGVDAAAWCSYKYLNEGPGCIAGLYVNEQVVDRLMMRGWWGSEQRLMRESVARSGASRFAMSNPCFLSMACLHASLLVFAKTRISDIERKAFELTRLFRDLVIDLVAGHMLVIVTPMEFKRCGAQLTITFPAMPTNVPSEN